MAKTATGCLSICDTPFLVKFGCMVKVWKEATAFTDVVH